jgi:hypothetical protein
MEPTNGVSRIKESHNFEIISATIIRTISVGLKKLRNLNLKNIVGISIVLKSSSR